MKTIFLAYLAIGQIAVSVFIVRWYLQPFSVRQPRWAEGCRDTWLWGFAWPLMVYREFRRPAHD